MSALRPYENAIVTDLSSTLPVGDPGNATLKLDGAQGATINCTAASSCTGLVKIQWYEGGGWDVWECWEYAPSGPTFTYRAPNTTITLSANDTLFVKANGAYAIQFDLGGTSGTVHLRTCEEMDAFLMERLISGGITIGASSNIIGGVASLPQARTVQITPTMDTSAYTANDVWFDTTAITNAARATDAAGYLVGITIIDQDDQAAADGVLYILSANVSLGTINNAPSISDANALNILHRIPFTTADWEDLGGVKINRISPSLLPAMFFPASGTRTLYVAGRTGGTPTQTASGIKVTFLFQDAITGA